MPAICRWPLARVTGTGPAEIQSCASEATSDSFVSHPGLLNYRMASLALLPYLLQGPFVQLGRQITFRL